MKTFNRILLIVLFFSLQSVSAQNIHKWKLDDLKKAIASATQPTVFNFWATFCKPCVHEIPYFQQLVDKYKAKGVKLILVSLDLKESYPMKIKNFAAQRKFTAPIFFLDETNADIFCPAVDSSWSGALPASLFVNNATGYHGFFEGELTTDKFEEFIKEMLVKK